MDTASISRSSEMTNSCSSVPLRRIERGQCSSVSPASADTKTGRSAPSPRFGHRDVVPAGRDSQQSSPLVRHQQLLAGAAQRLGKLDIGPRRPAVVGVGESDITAVRGGADPDPARAGLVDRHSRRCVVGNAQRPDRPVAPVDNAGQEPFAGVGVQRDRVGGGKQHQHLLGRVQRGRLVHPRQRATLAGHRVDQPCRWCRRRILRQRRGRCHEEPVVERRKDEVVGDPQQAVVHPGAVRRAGHVGPTLRSVARRGGVPAEFASSQRDVAAGGCHLGRTATGHVDTGIAGRGDLVWRRLLKRARRSGCRPVRSCRRGRSPPSSSRPPRRRRWPGRHG